MNQPTEPKHDDLPARLRELADRMPTYMIDDCNPLPDAEVAIVRQAADRIAALEMKILWHKADAQVANEKAKSAEAQASRYREALRRIAEFTPDMMPSLKLSSCIDVARMALEDHVKVYISLEAEGALEEQSEGGTYSQTILSLCERIAALEAENAKLRAVVEAAMKQEGWHTSIGPVEPYWVTLARQAIDAGETP